jgi:hypothetical protein
VSPKPSAAEAEEHVVYEVEAMCRAAARYAQEWDERVNQATPSGYQDAVFFLEAALLHARTLIITFGFPDDKARDVTAALGLPDQEAPFREALKPLGLSAGQVYGQLSELIAHIGGQRWDAPLGIQMHRPVGVATTVLDALHACGATSNLALAAAVQAEQTTLSGYR